VRLGSLPASDTHAADRSGRSRPDVVGGRATHATVRRVAHISVGSISIHPIVDGTAVLHPSMFTTLGPAGPVEADWQHYRQHLDPSGNLVIPVGAFLVRTADRLVLLDAGVGDVHDEMFDGGRLLTSLRAEGVEPGDIDTIIVSHLHGDHMGWLCHDERSVFANATIHIGAADWEYFAVNPGGGKRRQARLLTVQSQVELVTADGGDAGPRHHNAAKSRSHTRPPQQHHRRRTRSSGGAR
jgi:glyoxylase-like metal-dependent hydrolase (beta-lactamase superfamily II)